MSKSIQILTIALIVQLLILATVLFSQNPKMESGSGLLLEFDPASIDGLIISDGTGEIEITREGDNWLLPSYGDLPVKADKVREVLDDLAKLKGGWPVATTEDAAKRFEVTVENAQKSLKLKSGSEIVGKIYLGTSPGFRKVHVRVSDDNNIYAVEFSQYRVSNKGEDWFDKSLLSFASDIEAVTIGTTSINKIDAGWNVSGLEPAKTDLSEVETWLKNLSTLQVSKLIEGNDKDKLLVLDPDLEIQVQGAGQMAAYKLWNKDDKYYIKSNDNTHLFEIAAYQAKKYFELDINNFAIDEEDESASTAQTQSPSMAPLMAPLPSGAETSTN